MSAAPATAMVCYNPTSTRADIDSFTVMDIQSRLPATFRSLYRLFLRTASATVLHHRQARRNLRQRWRPVFDDGAKVTRELQNAPEDAPDSWIKGREEWLKVWNKRSESLFTCWTWFEEIN